MASFLGDVDGCTLSAGQMEPASQGPRAEPAPVRVSGLVDVPDVGADYPHAESTFPKSRQILEEILVGCTEEGNAKIAGGSAARVYKLDKNLRLRWTGLSRY